MSATDQAFIRAYDPGLPPLAKPPRTARETVAAPPSTVQMPIATLTQNSGRLQSAQPPVEHATSIHMGIEHFVPPPHANFGSVSTTSVPAAAEAQASRTLLIPPHRPFGQTAKATLSSFTSKLRSASAGDTFAKPALEVDAVELAGVVRCHSLAHRGRARCARWTGFGSRGNRHADRRGYRH